MCFGSIFANSADNTHAYRMQFWKLVKANMKVLETIEGVRFDQMQAVFTDVTGLDTHL